MALLSVAVKTSNQPNQLFGFAVTAPGLEALCAAELRALGIRATDRRRRGLNGAANSSRRTRQPLASNGEPSLVRVAEFRAKAFFELELHAKRIRGTDSSLPDPRSNSVSRAGNQALSQRRRRATIRPGDRATRAGRARSSTRSQSTMTTNATENCDRQLFVVRFLHDVCTVSADSSGPCSIYAAIDRQVAKAPLRETLAAAMLLGADWCGDVPLTDPMCGSGTIPSKALDRAADGAGPRAELRVSSLAEVDQHDVDQTRRSGARQ